MLGSKSSVYISGAGILNAIFLIWKEGFGTYFFIRGLNTESSPLTSPVPAKLSNLQFPILIRPGTSDVGTIVSNIVREEYGQELDGIDPGWMIDAGAYIGDTSSYFLSRFPRLKIIALEPNPESYAIAKQNLNPYKDRFVLIQKGLSGTDKKVRFGGKQHGASIRDEGYEIECISVPTLLKQYELDHIDIFKMDIEGAEEAVFSSQPEAWMDLVGLFIMELHGPTQRSVIPEFLCRNGFSKTRYRSLWYFKH